MRLLVVFAVAGAGERLEADVTLKGSVARMRTVMDGQSAHAGEEFVAHVAL